MNNKQILLQLIHDNPILPIIPLVSKYFQLLFDEREESDPDFVRGAGQFGNPFIDEYAYYKTKNGEMCMMRKCDMNEEVLRKNVSYMSDKEFQEFRKNIVWKKAIFVFVDEMDQFGI